MARLVPPTPLRRLRGVSRLLNHPLNRRRKFRAFSRWLSWKIGSQLVPGPVIFTFVNDSKLIAEPGMNASTCNLYTGMYEFEEMAFALHFLRSDDVFIDVGANIGAYSILAAGVCGAMSVAVEPVPATFDHLLRNVDLNRLHDKIDARNVGLAARQGKLRFTTGLDSVNHVAIAETSSAQQTIELDVITLDAIAASHMPIMLKIDVEGFETEVVAGGSETIANPALRAIVIELNGSGGRYGYDEFALRERLSDAGFLPFHYRPFERLLQTSDGKDASHDNTLYVRDIEFVTDRLRSAPAFHVDGYDI